MKTQTKILIVVSILICFCCYLTLSSISLGILLYNQQQTQEETVPSDDTAPPPDDMVPPSDDTAPPPQEDEPINDVEGPLDDIEDGEGAPIDEEPQEEEPQEEPQEEEQEISQIPLSTSNRCGPNYGRCGPNRCCSPYGWCGTGSDYCKDKNKLYHGVTITPSPSKKTLPIKDSSITITDSRTDGRCGSKYGYAKCKPGVCCSPSYWCGTTSAHCKDKNKLYHGIGATALLKAKEKIKNSTFRL